MIELINNIHGITWAGTGWFLLYIISIGFFLIANKERSMRTLAVAMIFQLIVMYNPFVIHLLSNFFGPIEYTRIAWGFLMVPMIAFMITTFIVDTKKTSLALITAAMLIMMLALNYTPFFNIPENVYKIPTEAIEIVEILDSENPDNSYTKVGLTFPSYNEDAFRGELSTYDKIYYGMLSYTDTYYLYPTTFEQAAADNFPYEYHLAMRQSDTTSLTTFDFELIGETEHCLIYKKK